MARLHTLQLIEPNKWAAIIHVPAPTGTTSAGFDWQDVIKATGRNSTSLAVGKGPGQITQEEKDQIEAGLLLEGFIQYGDDAGMTEEVARADLLEKGQITQLEAAQISHADMLKKTLSNYIDREGKDLVDKLVADLDWYGHTVE